MSGCGLVALLTHKIKARRDKPVGELVNDLDLVLSKARRQCVFP